MRNGLGTVLETVADVRRDRIAMIHGQRSRTWRELDDHAARLAGYLAGAGIGPQARVGMALYNSPEYIESVFAAFKLRAVPVNVNYRYRRAELEHILTDAGVRALIYDGGLERQIAAAAPAAPSLRALVRVGDGAAPAAGSGPAAVSYADALTASAMARGPRGDDHWLMYTGGTTGVPKGVLTRHSWL